MEHWSVWFSLMPFHSTWRHALVTCECVFKIPNECSPCPSSLAQDGTNTKAFLFGAFFWLRFLGASRTSFRFSFCSHGLPSFDGACGPRLPHRGQLLWRFRVRCSAHQWALAPLAPLGDPPPPCALGSRGFGGFAIWALSLPPDRPSFRSRPSVPTVACTGPQPLDPPLQPSTFRFWVMGVSAGCGLGPTVACAGPPTPCSPSPTLHLALWVMGLFAGCGFGPTVVCLWTSHFGSR